MERCCRVGLFSFKGSHVQCTHFTSAQLRLECGASGRGVGAMLMQLTKTWASPPMRKEMMAIFRVVETWHPYLIWSCFQIEIIVIVWSIFSTIGYHPWRNTDGSLRCIGMIMRSYTTKATRHLLYCRNMRRKDLSLPYPYSTWLPHQRLSRMARYWHGGSIHPSALGESQSPWGLHAATRYLEA